MELYPAIDLLGGRSVRLVQGDFARQRDFGDPVGTAAQLVAGGARHLHLVDLDGARSGRPANRAAVSAIVELAGPAGVTVQVGGGIRDEAGAEDLLAGGVDRVVVGTAALEQPDLVARLARRHPGAVAVGLDHRRAGPVRGGPGGLAGADRDGPVRGDRDTGRRLAGATSEVAVRGWARGSGQSLADVIARFEDSGVAALVVTDIGRDGTLAGPDLEGLRAVLEATGVDVIASGGVASADHLRALAALQAGGRRLAGAIVGLALREGRLSMEEAVAACAASG